MYEDSWLDSEGLSTEQRAQEKVQNLLLREFDVFGRETRNKEYDPMILKSKVDFLSNEYLQISNAEQDNVKLIGFNKYR